MASRKRIVPRPISPRRKRRSTLPRMEDLEPRIVLSNTLPPNIAGAEASGLYPTRRRRPTWCPTSWRAAGRPGCRCPAPPGSWRPGAAPGTTKPFDPGVILGGLPAASPLTLNGPQQTTGPTGYIPIQLQTAYGIAAGGSYNSGISYAGIKGDGAGQTIGIFEEGYNPGFVATSDPGYSASSLAVFDQTFGLPDPPSLTFVDHTGTPLSSSNNSSNNPDFYNYGAGDEIALDIESAHVMAPAASIVVLSATPGLLQLLRRRPPGHGDPGGPARHVGRLGQLRRFHGLLCPVLWPGGHRAGAELRQHDHPAGRGRQPGRVPVRGVGRQRDGLRADLPVGLARGHLGRRHQPVSQQQ